MPEGCHSINGLCGEPSPIGVIFKALYRPPFRVIWYPAHKASHVGRLHHRHVSGVAPLPFGGHLVHNPCNVEGCANCIVKNVSARIPSDALVQLPRPVNTVSQQLLPDLAMSTFSSRAILTMSSSPLAMIRFQKLTVCRSQAKASGSRRSSSISAAVGVDLRYLG